MSCPTKDCCIPSLFTPIIPPAVLGDDDGFDPVLSQYGFIGYPPTEYIATVTSGLKLDWTVPDVNLGYPRLGGFTQDGGNQQVDLVYWFSQTSSIDDATGVYVYGQGNGTPEYVFVPKHNYVFCNVPAVVGQVGDRPSDVTMVLNTAGGGTLSSYVGGAVFYSDGMGGFTLLFDGFVPNDITGFSIYRKNSPFVQAPGIAEGLLVAELGPSLRTWTDLVTHNTDLWYRIVGHTNQFSFPYNDVISAAQTSTYWTRPFGLQDSFSSGAGAIGAHQDPLGNIFIAGSFVGNNKFSNGFTIVNTSTVPGINNFYIAKYSPSGSLVWAKGFGNLNHSTCAGMAVDGLGSVIIAGVFSGTLDFGGLGLAADMMTSNETESFYIAKYTTNGSTPVLAWKLQFAGAQNCTSVCVDRSNNIIITGGYGYYGSTVNFGGGNLPYAANSGGYYAYVAKFSTLGVYKWARGFGVLGRNIPYAVAVDNSVLEGNVAITGSFQNSITFGGSTFTSVSGANGSDLFVAKLSAASGAHLWSYGMGGATGRQDRGQGIAIAPNGNVAVGGLFQGTINFGGGNVSGSGPNAYVAFVVTWNAAGVYQTALQRTIEPIYGGQVFGVAFDSAGNVVICGLSSGLGDYGSGLYIGGGTSNLFIVKYNGTTGLYAGGYVIGGSGNATQSVALGPNVTLLVTGNFGGALDFGSNPDGPYGVMISPGASCGFVAKLPSALPI